MSGRIIPCMVTDEYVRGAGVVVGAAGSHNDVALRLEFGSMWAGTSRSIVWKDALGGNATVTVLGTDLLVSGESEVYLVPIPAEPKKYAGELSMTIKGASVNGETETSATLTATAHFIVMESDWDEDAEESGDIAPTVAEQLQAEIDDIKDTIVNAAANERNAAASAAAALESKNSAVSARDLSQAYLQQSIQYYARTEGSAAKAEEAALQAAQRADNALAEAQEAEAQANRAQAEADRATIPAVAGIYNIIIPDRTTGEKYAVLFEGGKLYLLGVASTMQATEFALVDSASGKNYRLGVENKLLIVEEV